jgi:hypothetical protein
MLCGYQNQSCVPSGYQSGYLLLYSTWENPKPWFWHFEPWFSKVLEIFENTLLYITTGSFDSGGGGEKGRRRFLYPPLVWWERHAIWPSFLPFRGLQCFVETIYTRKSRWSNPVTDWHRSSVASPVTPSPTPQNPRETDGHSELIYMIILHHIPSIFHFFSGSKHTMTEWMNDQTDGNEWWDRWTKWCFTMSFTICNVIERVSLIQKFTNISPYFS